MKQAVIYLLMVEKFKFKDSEVVATQLCLGNVSKDWTVDNMKNTGVNAYVYNFSVDYDATGVDDTSRFIKKVFVAAMSFFKCNALKCVSMSNQECKVTPEIININSNESSFYLYSIK